MQWHLETECPKQKDRIEEMASENAVTMIEVHAEVHATQNDGCAVCTFCNSEDHGHFKCPKAPSIFGNLMGEYMFSQRSPISSVSEDSGYHSEETQIVDDSTLEPTPTGADPARNFWGGAAGGC